LRPDLTFTSLRGNIPTRIVASPGRDAVVVAVAALQRLGLDDHVAEVLAPEVMLPQVAQGALAVECRAGDDEVAGLLAAIDDGQARRAVEAERAFLARLGGGCELPVGAYATDDGQGTLAMDAMIATQDGRAVLRDRASGPSSEPAGLGIDLADRLLHEVAGISVFDGVS
jgi:hydroxymethylbilane synthase